MVSSATRSPGVDLRDNVSRLKRSTPLGRTLFVLLRGLDVLVQHSLLVYDTASPLLNAIGIPPLPAALAEASSSSFSGTLSALPAKPRILLCMAVGSFVKQAYWSIFISENEMRPGDAVGISIFNTICNSLNSIVSTTAPSVSTLAPFLATSALGLFGIVFPPNPDPNTLSPVFCLGVCMYIAGLVVETAAEVQRAQFKARPENKGKIFTKGLFGTARHINYGAYTLWRSGYALAAGGPAWGTFVFWFFFRDFNKRGVPVLDQYCSERYGEQWNVYKRRVPYSLIPRLH